jgi:hypothetical protein
MLGAGSQSFAPFHSICHAWPKRWRLLADAHAPPVLDSDNHPAQSFVRYNLTWRLGGRGSEGKATLLLTCR